MAEPVDYLGRPAPVSLEERPSLPVSGIPVPGGPSGGGAMAPGGGAGGAPVLAGTGMVATTPTGAPGIPNAPGAASAVEIAQTIGESNPNLAQILLQAGSLGGRVFDMLKKVGLAQGPPDSPSSVLSPSDFSLAGEGGAPVLRPEDFSLFEEGGGSALRPEDFDLGDTGLNARLPGALPELGLLMGDIRFPEGFFSFGGTSPGSVLSPGDFSLGGASPDSVLASGDFSLGADGSAAGGGGVPYLGALLSLGASLGSSLANGGTDDLGAALTKGIIGAGQSAVYGAAGTLGSVAGLFMLPKLIGDLESMFSGDVAGKRRAQRTMDATRLQNEILQPLATARTAEDFNAALKTPVAGSTVGDALAAMLWQNLSGGWFSDTAHGWTPDLTLLPLLTYLTDQGFSGRIEPRRGDVGGVGEIVAGAGERLRPPDDIDALYQAWLRGGGQGEFTPPQGFSTGPMYGAPSGAAGWEGVLRNLAGAVGGAPITAPSNVIAPPPTGAYRPMVETIAPGLAADEGGQPLVVQTTPPMLDPAYVEALRTFDPALADRVTGAAQAKQDEIDAIAWAYHNAP